MQIQTMYVNSHDVWIWKDKGEQGLSYKKKSFVPTLVMLNFYLWKCSTWAVEKELNK